MPKNYPLLLLLLLLLLPLSMRGQGARLEDSNAIGWYVYEGDHRVRPRWEVHTEVQARRTHLITNWQQLLLRGGLRYALTDKVKLGGGYTHLVTYPYGKYPTADQGRFAERRLYEEVEVETEVGRLQLAHRVRLEQRWVAESGSPDTYTYQNRIRYQLLGVVPLQGPELDDGEWYFTAFDELFLNFGPEVAANVFNQNRVAGGFGYHFAKDLQLEALYLSQITQHGEPDEASGRPVFEFNRGFRLGLTYNLDFGPQ